MKNKNQTSKKYYIRSFFNYFYHNSIKDLYIHYKDYLNNGISWQDFKDFYFWPE